jgi:putative acetyltransferase
VEIVSARIPNDLPAITQLFRAYAASLPIDLGYQGFDGELASLPGKYAPPQGALLIAHDANTALGCVAMRPLPSPQGEGVIVARSGAMTGGAAAPLSESEALSPHPTTSAARNLSPSPRGEGWSVCEMKRLYVTPEGRGCGLGRAHALAIIDAARAAGHAEMRLDTLAHMTQAQALYRALGFVEIAPYYQGAPENTVFMSLKL